MNYIAGGYINEFGGEGVLEPHVTYGSTFFVHFLESLVFCIRMHFSLSGESVYRK